MTGQFRFKDMTIQVEQYRSDAGEVTYWLRRVDSPLEITVGVKRGSLPVSVSNAVRVDPAALDAALADFLNR